MIFEGSLPCALALLTFELNSLKSTYGSIALIEPLDGSVEVDVVVSVKFIAVSEEKKNVVKKN